MRFKDRLAFVLSNMKKNRMRVFMTVLASTMGCAFLIVLASVGFGVQKTAVEDITGGRLLTQIDTFTTSEEKPFIKKDIDMMKEIDHVKAVTSRQRIQNEGNVSLDGYSKDLFEVFVPDFKDEQKAGLELSKGRFPQAANEVVVGYHYGENLSKVQKNKKEITYKASLYHKTLTLTIKQKEGKKTKKKTIALKVVGVGEKPPKRVQEGQELFLTKDVLQTIEAFTKTPKGMSKSDIDPKHPQPYNTYDDVKVYADDAENVESIEKELKKKEYVASSRLDSLKEINFVFLFIKIGLIVVGTVAVLIASIGIFNTMTMAVTERTQDIGIMKAIGAHPRSIKQIFLLESVIIGGLGAVLGTIISYLFSFAANALLPVIISTFFQTKVPDDFYFSYIPLSLPLISFAICFGVTLLSGMRPARRATKIDVLRALRRDV
ncbi:metabolite permease [Fictibacillus macauensis ZFHKF-1]|uniref:Metabolite permease n=1 Tax=Fictibacillus macauensis ZFHKF-1 TaxID=1196324 RepID=I8AMD7_9BACL|nr:ABC transporter permease [Fictibacillus macauensis]EIT87132.1 metabolite permease [Fictibacillus macauensis ZFHKF-1]